jgi:uncharacterized protein YjbI with pentapeptide repeats
MANQEQLDLLKQGSDVWNTWRKQHPSLRPDLSGANLTKAYLKYVHLGGANLSEADLSHTKLNEETRITQEQIGQAKPGTHA